MIPDLVWGCVASIPSGSFWEVSAGRREGAAALHGDLVLPHAGLLERRVLGGEGFSHRFFQPIWDCERVDFFGGQDLRCTSSQWLLMVVGW